MKRTKKLYILLGVLVVICIATFALSKTEEKKENIKNSDKTVLEVDSDSVNKISWKSSLGSLAFEKKDGTWTYTDDANFPVDQDKIAERLKLFKEFGVAFEIEDVDDYGQYGLDDPECTITLETDDKTYEISLGDYSTMDSQRYVSIGDGNVYLVKNDPMDSFNVTIDALVKNDEIPNFNQVEKISEIKVSGSTSLDAKYKENDGLSDNEDDIYFVNKDKDKINTIITDAREILSVNPYQCEVAGAFMSAQLALCKGILHRKIVRTEIDEVFRYVELNPYSESLRELFFNKLLPNSTEEKNRAHYLTKAVVINAQQDARYNPMSDGGVQEIADFEEGLREFLFGENKYQEPYKRVRPKVGANELCPCGSGKKFKKCCRGNGKYD